MRVLLDRVRRQRPCTGRLYGARCGGVGFREILRGGHRRRGFLDRRGQVRRKALRLPVMGQRQWLLLHVRVQE